MTTWVTYTYNGATTAAIGSVLSIADVQVCNNIAGCFTPGTTWPDTVTYAWSWASNLSVVLSTAATYTAQVSDLGEQLVCKVFARHTADFAATVTTYPSSVIGYPVFWTDWRGCVEYP